MEYGVIQPIDVYFDQLDAARTLYHGEYVRLVDRAAATYWESKGYHHDPDKPESETFILVREFSITFDRPIRNYGRVLIHLWIERVGTTSYVMGFRILSASGQEEYAHGHRVLVSIDPATMRPAPITGRSLEDLQELTRPVPAPA
ncbi:hotdog domain-containing protein [Actinoplanes sp. NPDC049596]|uniref:acyl-CoA thioesterase n=1 Tax=unclassified Actinoplanes TaxID=2626549 RepID=UPI0034234734